MATELELALQSGGVVQGETDLDRALKSGGLMVGEQPKQKPHGVLSANDLQDVNVPETDTTNDLPDNLALVRTVIEEACPHGKEGWNHRTKTRPKTVEKNWKGLDDTFRLLASKHGKIMPKTHPMDQLGSLGGGNHFIEICLDENDDVWFMLHSGSRGIGNRIGNFFITEAKKDMENMFIRLPDKDLAYFAENTENFNDYFHALTWAQEYARLNRETMMENMVTALKKSSLLPQLLIDKMAVNCHHNYTSRENHYGSNILVTRKGAVSAREGQLGIIPGSMGAKSFIVKGKGNQESFCSCSHGAGRKMSRSQAKKVFTLEDHAKAREKMYKTEPEFNIEHHFPE